MKIYTRKGDDGFTTRYDGSKVAKDEHIIILVAKIDSLLASLDSSIISIDDEEMKKILEGIQQKLWQTAGELSLGEKGKKVTDIIDDKDIELLEKTIDIYDEKHTYFVRFRTESSTRLNNSRIICRELEVKMTKMLREKKLRPQIYKYINRLSDLLFVLACRENT